MNWVKKHKLLAVKAVQFNGWPYIKLENLWSALHSSFNSAQSHEVDLQLLDDIPDKVTESWTLFSREELINAIEKCNNLSASGPDKLTWSHIRRIIQSKECIAKFIDIANTCIDLGCWPSHFKMSMTVIILKPNKAVYNSPKSFHPIILLNMIGKLFEKMIGEHLQFLMISNNFIHLCQLGGLKQRFTTNVRVALTHFICSGWVKNLSTSMLAFDIFQFFPFLNHQLLSLIMDKAGLDYKVSTFFKNYLVRRKTKYLWNDFLSPLCSVDVGVGQGSALSLMLSSLYLSSIFHILEKCLKILKIPISIISFVDNGLFISQNKFIPHSNANLFYSYNVISSLLMRFSLVVKYRKTKVFYFSRSHGAFNPSSFNLTTTRGPILLPKTL